MIQPRRTKASRVATIGCLMLGCTGVATTQSQPTVVPTQNRAPSATTTPGQNSELAPALAELAAAHYQAAEIALRHIIATDPTARSRAEVALAEVWLMTGRREQALPVALSHCGKQSPSQQDACYVAAECLRRKGEIDRAIDLLNPFTTNIEFRRLRLLLADILAERGLSSEARLTYRRLVDDHNDNRVSRSDARELAISGRAAHRLGAFRDANELFNQAERTGVSNVETLLWRGALYLDAHDPRHAREVADEALKYAPNHPEGLLLFARVRLAESRDTAEAETKAQLALQTDPTNADAHYVLAGLALRDLEFDQTHRIIDQGLTQEPRHLDLLSLRAAARFLADETESFQDAVAKVLGQNPNHARLFRLIAGYAEAEHRYADTIPLLRRAMALDPNDAQVHAQLAIQLLRSGEESEGRRELIRAFAQDPFDLRVRNTLVLFEKKLDHEYTQLRHPPFTIRVPTALESPLEKLIPPWLDTTVSDMNRRYGRLDTDKLTLELYADQDSFGVRTSGDPASVLQGVCFGHTVVARLPTDEPVNIGMTLWHELSHVYHLQLSNYRVPRWFTEGLAEVETKRHRPEWSREQELRVYEAFLADKIPTILEMNRAFSHAANLDDLAVAYVSSTYLVEHLVQSYGFAKMPRLLAAWGKKQPTERVLTQVLGTSIARLNQTFTESLRVRFARFKDQYLPLKKPTSLAVATEDLAREPDAPQSTAALIYAQLLAGNLEKARETQRRSASRFQTSPDFLWLDSLLLMAEGQPERALLKLDEMVAAGFDGYFIQLQRALLSRQLGRTNEETRDLERAHHFHPSATEPLYRLVAKAREAHDEVTELKYLSDLCQLEESDAKLHRRHVELRLKLGQKREAWAAAETLLYVAPLTSSTHELTARAALALNNLGRATRELNLAAELASPPDRLVLEGWIGLVRRGQRSLPPNPNRPTEEP